MVWWSDKLALSQGKEWQIYLRKTLDAQSSSWHTGDRVMEKRWPSWTKHAHLSQGEKTHQVFTESTIHRPQWPKPSVQLSWARRYSICNSDRQRLVHNFLSSSRENPWLRSELPKFTHDRNQETSLVLAPYSLRGLGQGKFLSDMASEGVFQPTGTTQSFDGPFLLPRKLWGKQSLACLFHSCICRPHNTNPAVHFPKTGKLLKTKPQSVWVFPIKEGSQDTGHPA